MLFRSGQDVHRLRSEKQTRGSSQQESLQKHTLAIGSALPSLVWGLTSEAQLQDRPEGRREERRGKKDQERGGEERARSGA